jgi:leucyl-tRNA synthetase
MMDSLSPAARKMQRKLHQTIQRVTEDFGGRWHFNTSICGNHGIGERTVRLRRQRAARWPEPAAPALLADAQRKLVLMLAPFAPYLAHELWEMLGETSDLLRAPWPQYDPALAKEEEVEIGDPGEWQDSQPHRCPRRRRRRAGARAG